MERIPSSEQPGMKKEEDSLHQDSLTATQLSTDSLTSPSCHSLHQVVRSHSRHQSATVDSLHQNSLTVPKLTQCTKIHSLHQVATGTQPHVPPRRRAEIVAILVVLVGIIWSPQTRDWDVAPTCVFGPNFISLQNFLLLEPEFLKSLSLARLWLTSVTHVDRRENSPPGGFSYLLCSPIKTPEEGDPPRSTWYKFFEEGPLPPDS